MISFITVFSQSVTCRPNEAGCVNIVFTYVCSYLLFTHVTIIKHFLSYLLILYPTVVYLMYLIITQRPKLIASIVSFDTKDLVRVRCENLIDCVQNKMENNELISEQ